jgi:hypothetical protein
MSRGYNNYYSVYLRKTDMPVIIHGNTLECMAAMGISRASFYSYFSHTKHGTRKCKYEVYKDEEDE